MKNQTNSYTEGETRLLYGKIRYTRYMSDLQNELQKMGKNYKPSYIRRILCGQSYNENIWLAAHKIVTAREKQIKRSRANLVPLESLL